MLDGILYEKKATEFCSDYNQGLLYVKAFGWIVTGVIAVFNIAARYLNMFLIKKIGYNYESE